MTTLILTQSKYFVWPVRRFGIRIKRFWEEQNQNCVLTNTFATAIFLFILAYLVALYFSFGMGVTLQQKNYSYKEIKKNLLADELLLQRRLDTLAFDQKNIIESMERVSAMRYLSEPSVVSVATLPNP